MRIIRRRPTLDRAAPLAVVGLLSLWAADAQADDPTNFSLDTSKSTTQLDVGAKGRIALHIKPSEGYKVNQQGPLKVKVVTSDGLEVDKSKLGRADAKGQPTAPEFQCSVKAKSGGKNPVTLEATFVLCDTAGTICEMKREKVELAIQVD